MIPSIFEARSRSLDVSEAERRQWSRAMSGALIGFCAVRSAHSAASASTWRCASPISAAAPRRRRIWMFLASYLRRGDPDLDDVCAPAGVGSRSVPESGGLARTPTASRRVVMAGRNGLPPQCVSNCCGNASGNVARHTQVTMAQPDSAPLTGYPGRGDVGSPRRGAVRAAEPPRRRGLQRRRDQHDRAARRRRIARATPRR